MVGGWKEVAAHGLDAELSATLRFSLSASSQGVLPELQATRGQQRPTRVWIHPSNVESKLQTSQSGLCRPNSKT